MIDTLIAEYKLNEVPWSNADTPNSSIIMSDHSYSSSTDDISQFDQLWLSKKEPFLPVAVSDNDNPDEMLSPKHPLMMYHDNIAKNISELDDICEGPKLLYMDGLNYGSKFFSRSKSHWLVQRAVAKIKRFVQAATNSGWHLKVFLDAAVKSKEAMQKWRTRREAEVRTETRNMPQGLVILLGDAFRENGVEVLYSVEADNDDTLAAYASKDGAAILSGDRDFFRYIGLKCSLYETFEVKENYLHLNPLYPNNKRITKRHLISPPPKIMDRDPSLVDLSSQHLYRRGAPSALVKRLGNIHVPCRSLRQALYARKGIKDPVLEIFPIWENDQVVWLEEQVLPDDKLDNLLDQPSEALETLFPQASLVKPDGVTLLDWNNHLYAINAVIYELCALGNKNRISFLQLLLPTIVKFMKESKRVNQKPAYETTCLGCKISIILYEKDVVFFESKGFSMPKRCKECKQLKVEKSRNNDFKANRISLKGYRQKY